ncbi:MAG: AsnC family transcriptional regulator [Candidatus Marinimicrobia bacterium]|nr:AsnC family transcriptional regulator [Candidatus Neomarinimicrobiota bacterium]
MIDKVDHKILEILQNTGRDSASHIATEIGMSVPAVSERIHKLEESGIISGYEAIVDPKKVGLDVAAIITLVSESSRNFDEIVKLANETQEVVQCFTTTGAGSHLLIVNTENSESLEWLLREIQSWPGVLRTETQLILSSYKAGHHIKIP